MSTKKQKTADYKISTSPLAIGISNQHIHLFIEIINMFVFQSLPHPRFTTV